MVKRCDYEPCAYHQKYGHSVNISSRSKKAKWHLNLYHKKMGLVVCPVTAPNCKKQNITKFYVTKNTVVGISGDSSTQSSTQQDSDQRTRHLHQRMTMISSSRTDHHWSEMQRCFIFSQNNWNYLAALRELHSYSYKELSRSIVQSLSISQWHLTRSPLFQYIKA